MLGIVLGTEDGILELIPGSEPERPVTGIRVTSLDYRDGVAVAAAEDEGVWVHDGRRWEQRWEGEPTAVRVAPDGRLYAGTEAAGLWLSDDRGETWNEIEGMRNVVRHNSFRAPAGHAAPYVAGVAFPKEGVLVAIAGGGAWFTRDDGQSWLERGDGIDHALHAMREHPEQRDRVFASAESGFYRSDDGGFSWVQSIGGLDRSWGGSLAVMPGSPDTLLFAAASRSDGGGGALFRSANGGVSWKWVDLGDDSLGDWDHMPVVARVWDSEDTAFAAGGGRVWGTHDAGRSWLELADGLPTPLAITAAL